VFYIATQPKPVWLIGCFYGGYFLMRQLNRTWKIAETSRGPKEADALLHENAELLKTATELLQQTAILGEALQTGQLQTKSLHSFD
jgi:hypothetical protein